ncbi:MAG: hypothetical protein ACOCUI_01260, partial [bacterium]
MNRLFLIFNVFLIALVGNSGYLEPEEVVGEHHEEEIGIDDIDLSHKPNEMGKVMVLMFHSIDDEDGIW